MRRITISPRAGWQQKVEKDGLTFHTSPDGLYWNEAAYYSFSAQQIAELETAVNGLHGMCLQAAQHIIDHDLFHRLAIPPAVTDMIIRSWEEEPPAIYGRFDFAYDGIRPPKMLEYNADTPTSLLEAGVIQWNWLQDLRPGGVAQFNSIHERLVAKWTELKPYLRGPVLHLAHAGTDEDGLTCAYMADTAMEAGLEVRLMLMKDIGWDSARRCFVDLDCRRIESLFKLFPWEWMIHDAFGPELIAGGADVQWIEPAWKMLLSNKGILPVLWELFPEHPNLLPAYFGDEPHGMTDYVRKPLLSREGANVRIYRSGALAEETGGDYGDEGHICQALATLPGFDGHRPVAGLWVIDGESAGMGIRESDGLITGNTSRFVPHLIEG